MIHRIVEAPQAGRTITEICLHHDTQPSEFRVPLPATAEAIKRGCTCPPMADDRHRVRLPAAPRAQWRLKVARFST